MPKIGGLKSPGDVDFSGSTGLNWDADNKRLGIGTSSPQSQLHLARSGGGTIRLENTLAGSLSDWSIQAGGGVGDGKSLIFYDNDNSATRVVINSSGNVGIGTATIGDAKLEISKISATPGDGAIAIGANTWQFRDGGTSDGDYDFFIDGRVSTTWYTRFAIERTTGNVGIGRTNPGSRLEVKAAGSAGATYAFGIIDSANTNLMYVRDDGYGYLKAASWVYGSDRGIKESIIYIDGTRVGLDIINELKPCTFDYISGCKNNVGFIAQDVQDVIPNAVSVVTDEGQLGLKTDFIIPYLTKAIQELNVNKAEQSDLELALKRIKALENK